MNGHDVVRLGWGLGAAMALTLGLGACGKDTGGEGGEQGPQLSIAVKPLSFPAVSDVLYRVTVLNATPETVWTKDASSTQYGDGAGALTLIGPCDASDGANPHTVQLSIIDILGTNGNPLPAGSWQNPAPVDNPVEIEATCRENQDVLVEFNLTVMRSAQQGFFDVVVNFEDIFCSAKLDCDNELLFNPESELRETTVVMGFACTAGQTAGGDPEPTWLHLTDIVIQCEGQQPIYFDPSQGPGQHGPLGGGTIFQTGVYMGQEQLPNYDKCYWNMAFGLNLPRTPRNCTITAAGTASHTSFQPGGTTPVNTVWPYVQWTGTLTDANGALACSAHALNAGDGVVQTQYTPIAGAAFQHEWECGTDTTTVVSQSLACAGAFQSGNEAQLYPTPTGLSVAIGGQRSRSYTLPDGFFLGNEAACCVNPCCEAPN